MRSKTVGGRCSNRCMAAIPAPEQQADSPAAVLDAIRDARAAANREEVRILELALDWQRCTSRTRLMTSGSRARS